MLFSRVFLIRITHRSLVLVAMAIAAVVVRFLIEGDMVEAFSASIIGIVFYVGASQMERNHSWLA